MALTKPVVSNTAAATNEVEEAVITKAGVEATAEVIEHVAEAPAQVVETAAEAPEAVAEQAEAPAAAETSEVAVVNPASAPAVQRANAMAQFTQEQAEAGFEGLELTGMSFDRIKLHEGKFLIGSEESELGTEFDCVVYATRNIYVVRQSTDNDAEAFYSYDPKGQTMTDGTSAQEKLADWLDDGYGTEDAPLDIRPYLEATVVLVNREDEYDGHMAMLSIPPASKARMAGAAAKAQMKFKGAKLNEVVTRCTVGKKVGDGQKAFRPWLFSAIERFEG